MKNTTKKNLFRLKLMVLIYFASWMETIHGQEKQAATGVCVSCVQTHLIQELKEITDNITAEFAKILEVVTNPDCDPHQKRYTFYAQREKNMVYQPQDGSKNRVKFNSNDHSIPSKDSNQKYFFDIESGIFTAPQSGTYFFEFHALKAPRWNPVFRSDMAKCIVKLVKEVDNGKVNGKENIIITPIAEGKVLQEDWYSSFPIQIEAIVELKMGETITVRLYDGKLTGGWLTSFTGFLISPKEYPIECEFDTTTSTTTPATTSTSTYTPTTATLSTKPPSITPPSISTLSTTTPSATTSSTSTSSTTTPSITTPSTTSPSTPTLSTTNSPTTTPTATSSTTKPSTTKPSTTTLSTTTPSKPCECHGQGSKCGISVAAAENMACKCFSSESKPDAKCTGEDVPCANPGSTYCKNPDKSYLSCLQGQGNCGDYERQTTASLQGCECNYRMPNGFVYAGGCIIKNHSPEKHACHCRYEILWKCYGTVVLCQDYNSDKCTSPDDTLSSCEQGGGDCGGYE